MCLLRLVAVALLRKLSYKKSNLAPDTLSHGESECNFLLANLIHG